MERHRRIKGLKKMVESTLEKLPSTRDSDVRLCIAIWERYFGEYVITGSLSGEKAVRLNDLYRLPREDNIKRLRAHIQNVQGKWLPTTWEVARKRNINQQEWNSYINTLGI